MSKMIKLTPEYIEQCKQEFANALTIGKFSDGRVTFTKTLGAIDRKAKVYFTEIAWLKMKVLVNDFDKEVAWHGVAHRGDEDKDEYFVTDILVYPQEVTGTTVTTDQEKYQTWLFEHDDDVFNNIRFQGHSHVNMGVSPSAVDTSLYERLLDQLDDDMFYIFMIVNKKNDKHIKIYDMRKNVLFETTDVTVEVLDGGIQMEKFIAEAKEMVKNKPYTPTTYGGGGYQRTNGGYNGYGYNGGYGSGAGANHQSQYGGGYSAPSGYARKEESGLGKTKALAGAKSKDSKKKSKRKGKRNKGSKTHTKNVSLNVRENYCMGYEDYEDYADCYLDLE